MCPETLNMREQINPLRHLNRWCWKRYYRDGPVLGVAGVESSPEPDDGVCAILVSQERFVVLALVQDGFGVPRGPPILQQPTDKFYLGEILFFFGGIKMLTMRKRETCLAKIFPPNLLSLRYGNREMNMLCLPLYLYPI